MAKKRVRSFEVSKMKSGKKGHAFKVTVHHHEQPGKAGKGMSAAMSKYVPPEEHAHASRAALNKHMAELTNSMSVSPDGDGDEAMPDGSAAGQPVPAGAG